MGFGGMCEFCRLRFLELENKERVDQNYKLKYIKK